MARFYVICSIHGENDTHHVCSTWQEVQAVLHAFDARVAEGIDVCNHRRLFTDQGVDYTAYEHFRPKLADADGAWHDTCPAGSLASVLVRNTATQARRGMAWIPMEGEFPAEKKDQGWGWYTWSTFGTADF